MADWDHIITELSFQPPHLLSDDEFLPTSAFRDLLASSSSDSVAQNAVIAVSRNFLVTLSRRLQEAPLLEIVSPED